MHYASRPRSFEELRWRLQLIAELRVGQALRAEAAEEDGPSAGLFAQARALTGSERPN